MDVFEPVVPETSNSLKLTLSTILTGAACFGLCLAGSLSTAAMILAFAGGSDPAFVLLVLGPVAAVVLIAVVVATGRWAMWNRVALSAASAAWIIATGFAVSRIVAETSQMVSGDTPGLGLALLALPMVVAALAGLSFVASLAAAGVHLASAIRSHR